MNVFYLVIQFIYLLLILHILLIIQNDVYFRLKTVSFLQLALQAFLCEQSLFSAITIMFIQFYLIFTKSIAHIPDKDVKNCIFWFDADF